jgi:putative tricarboxylic transport membrane protein
MEKRLEIAVAGILLLVATAFVFFIDNLVAPPKMLLGRSLTAIEPSLFPLVDLTMMIALCVLFLFFAWRKLSSPSTDTDLPETERSDWGRVCALFGILVLYALTLNPIGFLISTVIAMVLLSLLAGNRNVLQIVALSILSPIALYLVATRVLLVSLPELSRIEFAYAAVLGG